MRLVLASASPRRAELLRQAGYLFEIQAADIDESIKPGEIPETYVRRLAVEKSAAVAASAREGDAATDRLVLAADTTVVIDGDILGKPDGEEEAADMLRRLSGRPHEVLTGISLRHRATECGGTERTTVWMAPIPADELAWYVATGEGCDKAGAYAIQGLASRFITRIHGSYSNVVGLPVAFVHELIREASGEFFTTLHRASSRAILNLSFSRKSL
jgi:septum formation protein